jgi:gliding motility-associatede transport system auxiliary component
MSTASQRNISTSSLLLLALAFIAAIIISNQLFSGWRIDLTENRLYTLSDGTKQILESLEEPINLYFYYSDKASEDVPTIRNYANRIREMLNEFRLAANGNINLQVIDPLPFSEDEDRAAQFGLQGVGLAGSPDAIYMGLAGTDSIDNEEIIPFFQPDKEQFLEYDIAKLVSTLARPERKVVGLISGAPMSGNFDPQTQQMIPAWVIYEQAQQLFDLRTLGTDIDAIDDDVNMLWVVQPKSLSNSTLYAIDQFVLRGGTAMIFVDPLAESDPAAPAQGMPPGMPPQGQSSDLPTLFAAWGLQYSPSDVVADAQLALPVSAGPSGRPMRHPGLLGLSEAQLNNDDVITADLNTINVGVAGHLSLAEGSSATIEPLLSSSDAAGILASSRFSFLQDPSTLLNGFVPSGETYVIAARVSGTFPSAFPDGPPLSDVSSDDESEAIVPDASAHLSHAVDPVNLIIVADVDILSDRLWVQQQNFFGQRVANAFASNGAFVVNALESLLGSAELIAVRSRATYSRPFTKVEELRVEAEAQYRETEQRLQSELTETERRLGELQTSREDTGNILMTPEQQTEIDRFVNQRAAIRKDLRAVQRDLDKNIEQLGTRLKVVNTALVPVLLTVLVLVAAWRRSRRTSA